MTRDRHGADHHGRTPARASASITLAVVSRSKTLHLVIGSLSMAALAMRSRIPHRVELDWWAAR